MLMTERAEYDRMLAEAWAGTDQSKVAAKRLLEKLRDAEQAHHQWAKDELEALLLDGARSKCTAWDQSRNRIDTKDGRSVKTTGGVRGRDPDTGKPDGTHRQLPLPDMEQGQLNEYAAMCERQAGTLKEDAVAARRLLRLLAKVPEATTAREACKKLKLDPDAVMAGEEAV